MTLAELNACSREKFVEAIGWVFEHSPWVAERAWRKRPFTSFDDLSTRLIQEVQAASPDEQLALLCAHPDLGIRLQAPAADHTRSTPTSNAYSPPMPTAQEPPVPTPHAPLIPTAHEPPIPTPHAPPIPTAHAPPIPTAHELRIPTAHEPPIPTAHEPPIPTAHETPILSREGNRAVGPQESKPPATTPASAAEQSAAGLDQLTKTESELLPRLNADYRKKFGFPFLFAVKGSNKAAIIDALKRRLKSTPEQEFQVALGHVFRIARFRLEDTIQ